MSDHVFQCEVCAHRCGERMAYRVGRDAAEAMGITPPTLYRWLNAGEIRAVNINGARFISVEEMRRVLSLDGRRRRKA